MERHANSFDIGESSTTPPGLDAHPIAISSSISSREGERPSEDAAFDATLHSVGGAELDGLDANQQMRLVAILDEYLINAEEGRSFDVEQVMLRNPDLRDSLEHYLQGLQLVREIATDPSPGNGPAGSGDRLESQQQGEAGSHTSVNRSLEDATGGRLGPYQLGPVIGRGAMGIVYRATDVRLQKDVAVKVLAYGSVLESNRVDRFRREAQAAASLEHPNVVSVFNVGCDEGVHYYAMPLIHGASLDRWIAAAREQAATAVELEREVLGEPVSDDPLAAPFKGGQRYRRIARFCASAAKALDAAHRAGIIHRDVKPSNLILDNQDQLRITDFGLALVPSDDRLTRTGDLVGTVRYMSPEQVKGLSDQIGPRTDVYGLGATIYELVTLHTAHRSEHAAELLHEIQFSEPISPRELNPAIPRDLETIILRALRPRPCDRYCSAKAMADDLERFAEGLPIQASSVSVAEWVAGRAIRHRRSLLCATAAVVVALVGLAFHRQLIAGVQEKSHAAAEEAGFEIAGARRLAGHESLAKARLARWAGSTKEGDASYRNAIETIERALQSMPGAEANRPESAAERSELSLALSRAWTEWAMLARDAGMHPTALERLNAAEVVLAGVASNRVDVGKRQTAIAAMIANNRAIVLFESGRRAAAREEMNRAVVSLREVEAGQTTFSGAMSLRNDLAIAYANLSVLLNELGELDDAMQLAQASMRVLDTSAGAMIDGIESPGQLVELAVMHNNLASIEWRSGRVESAVSNYRDAVALLEKVIRLAPQQADPRERLAMTLNNLGTALATSKNYFEAEKAFERAVRLAAPSVAADPENAMAADRLGGIQNNYGVVLLEQGKISRAEEMFTDALRHQRNACLLSPSSSRYRDACRQVEGNFERIRRHRETASDQTRRNLG